MRGIFFFIVIPSFSALAQNNFTTARALLEGGEIKPAMQLLDSCQKAGYHIDSCFYYKGLASLRDEKIKAAKQYNDLLIRDYPSFYMQHYLKGVIFFLDRNFGKSIDELNLVLKADPANLKALYNRALAFGLLDDFTTARADLTRCIELAPGYAQAFYSRGYWAELAGQYDEAIADYQTTITLNPKNYDAYLGMAHIYQVKKETEKACEVLSKAVAAGSQIAEDVRENFCK
jgi:tetratricopeptide (TPR) repeat protein